MERELTLRIILQKPTADVDIGVQKGHGSEYETVQIQRSGSSDLRFEFAVKVKAGRESDVPVLAGPFVQGPPNSRFVYLDIGTYAGQSDTCWSRRLKIPLTGITSEMINKSLGKPGWVLETRVPGTGRDGGPNCGTVKPFNGWKATRSLTGSNVS